jgi:UDP-glucose 4-epimerase
MKKILVTGAYGYIGSHTVKALVEYGYDVYALDSKKSNNNIEKYISENIYISDVTRKDIYGIGNFDSVVHLAGLIDVAESVEQPWLYCKVNTEGTFNSLVKFNSDNFIFASTAAAFNPSSPYAQSKLLAESIIKAWGKNYTIFRFFNVAGNNGEFKQIGKATHLVRIAAETAAGKRPYITINGTDWDTEDGTCVRDYVHVSDLVNGIVKAVEQPSNKDFECIGTGINYSVRQVINTMKSVTNIDFEVREGPRRAGDSASIIVPPGMLSQYTICNKTLEDMCLSAYQSEL